MLRYGDAVFLQCGTHKASSLLENPPTSAAAPKGVGHSNHKSGGGKKSQQSHAKLLGCSAMAADAPVIVERAVQVRAALKMISKTNMYKQLCTFDVMLVRLKKLIEVCLLCLLSVLARD